MFAEPKRNKMATLANTIKKAEKVTGQKIQFEGGKYSLTYKGHVIHFRKNGGEDVTTGFYSKKIGATPDDITTDSFTGNFHDNLSQAIRFVDRY